MILLIDNYDSFTFNLYQLLGTRARAGEQLMVVRNDEIDAERLRELAPQHVVLSPGPGHPRHARLSLEASNALPDTPILGVCLGHQALGLTHGARVLHAPQPTHGRTAPIHHDQQAPFQDLPSPLEAALYHSLVLDKRDVPRQLLVTAWNQDGDVMGLRHRERPHYGVQFHPESFMTASGCALVDNFLHSP